MNDKKEIFVSILEALLFLMLLAFIISVLFGVLPLSFVWYLASILFGIGLAIFTIPILVIWICGEDEESEASMMFTLPIVLVLVIPAAVILLVFWFLGLAPEGVNATRVGIWIVAAFFWVNLFGTVVSYIIRIKRR